MKKIKQLDQEDIDFTEMTDAALIVDSWLKDFLIGRKYEGAIMTHPHRSLMNVFATQLRKENPAAWICRCGTS